MSTQINNPVWPAILIYAGDDELEYIESASWFMEGQHLGEGYFHPDDLLLDAEGRVYSVFNLTPLNQQLTLEEINQLLKRHLVQLGTCCIEKIQCESVRQAFAIVKSTL